MILFDHIKKQGIYKITSHPDDERIELINKRNRKLIKPEITVEINRNRERIFDSKTAIPNTKFSRSCCRTKINATSRLGLQWS